MAVLSTHHQVNLYDLTTQPPKYLRSVTLDNPPEIITLSPKGEVLAAAYDGGVEVHSLLEHALPTDSRTVKCDRVDSLAFSNDGTMLLGTTQANKNPNTVILSAPYFTDADHDLPHSEMVSHMWTSQILFPNSSRDCSHATLLPHQTEGDASWTLTYDRVFESFRAVRTDDLRNGTTYFTGPKPLKSKQRRRSKSRLIPCTIPTVTQKGDLVAAGFLKSEIWLYGVPEGLDVPNNVTTEDVTQTGAATSSSSSPTVGAPPSTNVTRGGSPELERLPRWQVLVDKNRNVFSKGRRVANVPGMNSMSWVSRPLGEVDSCSIKERLIVAAPGGVSGSHEFNQEGASVDGGRLIILDFDRTVGESRREGIEIEVGNIEPELLEEKNVDMATEIAIVRRRTVAQRNHGMTRISVVDALRPMSNEGDIPDVPPISSAVSVGFGLDSTAPEIPAPLEPITPEESPTEGLSLAEVSEALDGPYSHTQPRSRNTLYRSATAVAANRRRNPPQNPASGHVEYRRTDGTELPHESDADNWVPPPPPYTPDADGPLPAHLRYALTSPAHVAYELGSDMSRPPLRAQTTRESSFQDLNVRRRSSADADQFMDTFRRPPARRQSSDHSTAHPSRQGFASVNPTSSNSTSTPVSVLGATSTRRPMSAFERRASIFRGQISSQDVPPVPPLPVLDPPRRRPSSHQSVSLPASPIGAAFRSPQTSHLTLSGSNLQQRLDYPLPPPPSPGVSPNESPISLPQDALPHSTVQPPVLPPISIPSTSVTPISRPTTSSGLEPVNLPSMPSAYQLNNLQNRYSSLPAQSSASSSRLPFIRLAHGVAAPSPPRAALGAAGNRSSLTSNIIEAPARSLSRSNSRGSTRSRSSSQSYSASTPNLIRPQARRMDTIQSVASRLSYTRSRETERGEGSRIRTRSEGRVVEEEEEVVSTPIRERERERRGWMGRKGRRIQGERERDESGLEGERRVESRMGMEMGVGPEGKRKKGVRCLVM